MCMLELRSRSSAVCGSKDVKTWYHAMCYVLFGSHSHRRGIRIPDTRRPNNTLVVGYAALCGRLRFRPVIFLRL